MSPDLQSIEFQSLFRNAFLPHLKTLSSMQNNVQVTPFLRKDLCNAAGESPLYINLYVNGERDKIKLKFRCKPIHWDDNLKRIKSSAPSALDFNRSIGAIIERINKIVSDANCDEILLTKELIHKRLYSHQISTDFISFIESASAIRTDIKPVTKKSHRNTAVLLKSFKSNIQIVEFNATLLAKYKSFLERKSYKANYIHNQFKNLKVYYKLLQSQTGVKLPDVFSEVKTGWNRSGVTFLTISELNKMKAYYEQINSIDTQSTLACTLRYYLFSCHTGLRISDMLNLHKAINTENSLQISVVKHIKGKEKKLFVPMNKYAQKLWTEIVQTNYAHSSEQNMNRLLKSIAPDLQINKKITYHTSRHTFATAILRLGGKLHDVKDLLGHNSIKTTMIYAHVTNEDLQKSVDLMNSL